ncbi:hypothetical protein GCM10009560_41920 [Nonomuraea longicatena]|uniref:Lipoprotein n=2 Tax=Nonomuraea longicatena TaxID=83682 RepID=A0ABN1PX50_9ACTN
MRKAFSYAFLGMLVISGCSGGESAAPPAERPAPKAVDAARLGTALLPTPQGMQITYGPETGAYSSLKATKQGQEALKKATVNKSGCRGIGQLDADRVGAAPAAVVAYSSKSGSISQSLVATDTFPGPLPKGCGRYEAMVGESKVVYVTKELNLPKHGDQSRVFLTRAISGGKEAQIGAVLIQRAGVVASLLVVGAEIKRKGLQELARLADEKLARIIG